MTEKDMNLVEHLSELRKRLIVVISFFVLSLAAGFYYSPKILGLIKSQGGADNINWNVFGFTDGIFIYMKCAFIVSLLVTLPVAFYQAWAFVRPGLTREEAKGTFWYVPLSFFLFLAGASFSYFALFPMVIHFMTAINQSIGASETYGISQYFTFMFNIVFPISVVFEMPVVALFLTKLGIINPQILKKTRKIAYFVLIIVGITLTPPDFMSDIMISVPLILLYEFSILCSKWSFNKKLKRGANINV